MPQNSCAINQAWRLSPTPQILAFKHPVCWIWWRECRQDKLKTVKNIRYKALKLMLEFSPLHLCVQRFVLQIFFKAVNRERTKRPLAASPIWAVRLVSSPSQQQFLIDRETRVLVHFVAQDCYFGDIKTMSKKKLDAATGEHKCRCSDLVIWSVEGSDAGPSCVLHVRQYCLTFHGAKSPRKHVSTVFRGNYAPSDR